VEFSNIFFFIDHMQLLSQCISNPKSSFI